MGYVGGTDEEPPRLHKTPRVGTRGVLQFCAPCTGSRGKAKMIAIRPMVHFHRGLRKCWIGWRLYQLTYTRCRGLTYVGR
jgi:hypothetical protein